MKKVTAIISSLLLLASMQVTAQSWLGKIGKRVKEKVVEKVEQHIDDKTDETTGKVLDKAETLGKKQERRESSKHRRSRASQTTASQRWQVWLRRMPHI